MRRLGPSHQEEHQRASDSRPDQPQRRRHAQLPLPKLGGVRNGDFLALFADGNVRLLKKGLEERTLVQLVTRDGGEVVAGFPLEKKEKKPTVVAPPKDEGVENLKRIAAAIHAHHDQDQRLPRSCLYTLRRGGPASAAPARVGMPRWPPGCVALRAAAAVAPAHVEALRLQRRLAGVPPM